MAAVATLGLFFWITASACCVCTVQIASVWPRHAAHRARKPRSSSLLNSPPELGGIFIIVFGVVVVTTTASALAWSGIGLIAFVPLVGLAVFSAATRGHRARGDVRCIGLAAMGAYVALRPLRG